MRLLNAEKKVKAALVGASVAGAVLAVNKAKKRNKMINEYKTNNINKRVNNYIKKYDTVNKAKQQYKNDKKNVLKSFNNSLSKLEKSGKGNNMDEVIKLATKYDLDRKNAKQKYLKVKKQYK